MTDAPAFDVRTVRGRFPALARTGPDGRPYVYLDGPGGSQVPQSVVDAMTAYLTTSNANDGGAFRTSEDTIETIAAGRQAMADFTGATAEEIAFGANMTTLNFLLAHAVARTLAPGDEIVTTELDHDANVSPWLKVAADHGLVVRQIPVDPTDGTLLLDEADALFGPRTKVVAFTLASNALGTIPDARRLSDAAHAVGALAWADAVHFAPHHRIDRAALGVDVLLCSPYKFFGPHQGVAMIRRDLAESLPADRVRPADETPPGHRFETGTQSHEAIAGTVAAVDYLASLGEGATRRERLDDAYDRIDRYERSLIEQTLAGLERIGPGVRLHGLPAASGRTATFALTFERVTPREAAEALARRGIFAWDGNYYALSVMTALGLEGRGGALRVGYLHYTTSEEVDRLLEALADLAAGRG